MGRFVMIYAIRRKLRPTILSGPVPARQAARAPKPLTLLLMKKITVFLVTLICLASLAAAKPNVVVIISDDQGWGDLSSNGNTNLATPNVDLLAAEGAQFDRFFVSPACSPTRAEFLTGRYHPRSSVSGTGGGGERMDLDEETIAEMMRRAGYRTGLFGKWHNGTQPPYHPNSRGFEEFYGATTGYMTQYFDSQFMDHNGELTQGRGFIVDDVTEHAMDYIAKASAAQDPFFVCLTYNTPHRPMQVPQRFWDKFIHKKLKMRARNPEDEDVNFTRAALAMCENIDWNVGRLMAKLEELGVGDDTIVVYLSDNGPDSWRWNGGMKGKKGSTDEGGVRSPLFVRWPAAIKPHTVVRPIASVIDLRPTLTDLCGIEARPALPLDGISMKSELLGGPATEPDRILFSHWIRKVSARTQQYRLDTDGALFDMTTDPGQTQDISAGHPAVATRLREAVKQWRDEVLAEVMLPDTRPYPVGYPRAPSTWLLAGEAKLHGELQRSNHFPQSSFVIAWKQESDYLSWKVSVVVGGFYEAEIYYACPTGQEGSTIQLSLGESAVSRTLDLPNDAAIIGPADDIYPRIVSVDKTFKPMTLGTIHLPAGDGELRLSAPHIAGNEALEFRLLVLRPVGTGSEDVR